MTPDQRCAERGRSMIHIIYAALIAINTPLLIRHINAGNAEWAAFTAVCIGMIAGMWISVLLMSPAKRRR